MPANTEPIVAPVPKDVDFLGPSSITSENVQDAFREYFKDENIRLIKADAEIIAAGQGFTSYILRIALDWSPEDAKKHALPKSVILKALSKDCISKLMESFTIHDPEGGANAIFASMFNTTHKTECTVYEMFGKLENPPVPMARAYCTWLGDSKRPPLILLEDLGHRARVLGDGSASLDVDQLISLAESLANLHAWCLTTPEEWRKFETMQDRIKLFATFMPMMIAMYKKARQEYPDMFEGIDDEKITSMFSSPEYSMKFHEAHKQWMPDVLVHGDFWANNIMFEKLPDESMGNRVVAFIDWQMSMQGNPMMDIGRVFSMSVCPDLLEAHMENVIKHYYDTLKCKLADKMPKELSLDRVLEMANQQTAMSCLMMFFMQDTMHSLLAPPDSPDAEIKRERLIKRSKGGFKYAAKILDITVNGDK